MKLTCRSEYALLALVYLARCPGDCFVSVETIARAQGISPKFLEQILLSLKRARYLRSSRGKQGGYALGLAPDRISLAEIVRLFDGALAPTPSVSEYFYESTPIEREKALLQVFRDIREYVARKLEGVTVADVCSVPEPGGQSVGSAALPPEDPPGLPAPSAAAGRKNQKGEQP